VLPVTTRRRFERTHGPATKLLEAIVEENRQASFVKVTGVRKN
jgi:hypothetical protein